MDQPAGATTTPNSDAPLGDAPGRPATGRAATGRNAARRGATLAVVGGGVAAGLAGVAAGMGMATRYARLLTDPPSAVPQDPPRDDDRITLHVVAPDHVVAAGDGAARPGHWGVATSAGYGVLGPIQARTAAGVRRSFRLVEGDVVADHGVLDSYAHVNRASDLHPDGHEVVVQGEVGAMPAHHVPGDDVWVIGVHGRAASRHETFRAMAPLVAAGHTALAISYRNDHDAPPSPDGRSHLGGTEWRDVVAAMDHARGQGATRLVLVGCSMGGAIVGQVLARADVTDVAAVVLDAPVVDWAPVAAQAARDLGVPSVAVRLLMGPTRALARRRHSVDLDALRFDPAVLAAPTLVVHGIDDDVVPIAGSDRLAAARADVVRLLRVPGAGHVKSWNADPATYEIAVTTLVSHALRGRRRPATTRR